MIMALSIVKDVVSLTGAGIKSIINRRREKRAARKAKKASERVQEAQSVLASKLNLATQTPGISVNQGKVNFGETPKFEPIVKGVSKPGFFSVRNVLIAIGALLFGWFLFRKMK